ncbi:ATP-binding protein [Fulvivirgaceae bacterium BMA12]|uniref:histidine kinase n=1 Tax=Agaribacillus aureus TaxID=3051825 RepID=A0ABT8L030_9BACT|nr:ATP-binding protein [Fulvivirgaceae bacterium BMA12]
MNFSNLVTALQNVKELAQIPEEELAWIVQKGELLTIKSGDFLFKKGDPMVYLFIILQGEFCIKMEQGNQFRNVGSFLSFTITGLLPYSRAVEARGYAEAVEDSKIIRLHKDNFKFMITHHEELTTALVHVMSSRIRTFTKLEQQNDKMMALGKLSAGLAHELNNPSAAVVRSAQSLKKHLSLIPQSFKSVIKIRMKDEQVDAINNLLFSKIEKGVVSLTLIEKTSLEDKIAEWLEEQGVDDGYEMAENFVDFGFNNNDLQMISDQVPEVDMLPVINWINQNLTTEKLVNEIEDASQRINDLVRSVKSYTHMDQAPEKQPVDIHEGINNTLTMLNHKIKNSQIEVEQNYGVIEPVNIFVSEMNQVWTNLIDNAIDAMAEGEKKKLTITTRIEGKFVNVDIKDSGTGIPEEVIDNIFDPFFTTKAVGKGTGLGLDVVRQIINQHNGRIKVKSKPGETIFNVCIPRNQ